MNTDQAKGALKKAAGETQKSLGRLIGNKEQEAKGANREAEGTVQKTYGDAKEAVSNAAKAVRKATR